MMLPFDPVIALALGMVFLVCGILKSIGSSCSSSSNDSFGWWKDAKLELKQKKIDKLNAMLQRVLTDRQEVLKSDFEEETSCYYVQIVWDRNGEKIGKILRTFEGT